MPDGVTSIGDEAFYVCSGLTNIVFEGNAPAVGFDVFYEVASGCCAYVRRDSTGWGVGIPGRWNEMAIGYLIRDMSAEEVLLSADSVAYSGSACESGFESVTFAGKALSEGIDYQVSYSNNTNAGTATVTLTGINFYSGTYTTNFTIRPRPLTQGMVGAIGNHPYTGKAQTPKPTVTGSRHCASCRRRATARRRCCRSSRPEVTRW